MVEQRVNGVEGLEPGSPTRERLLDAAERLFAEHGFAEASVRDITAEAGVNLAAVNYHFGGKENLYRAMVERRLHAMREQRLGAIARALSRPDGERSIEDLVRRVAESFLDPQDDGGRRCILMRLMSREITEPRLDRNLLRALLVEPVEAAFVSAARTLLPGLGFEDARFGMYALVGQVMHMIHMAVFEGTLEERRAYGYTFDQMIDSIVGFTSAGLRARAGGSRA